MHVEGGMHSDRQINGNGGRMRGITLAVKLVHMFAADSRTAKYQFEHMSHGVDGMRKLNRISFFSSSFCTVAANTSAELSFSSSTSSCFSSNLFRIVCWLIQP